MRYRSDGDESGQEVDGTRDEIDLVRSGWIVKLEVVVDEFVQVFR